MSRELALYYDLGSPYAYLAVERAPAVFGTQPELRPVLLGAIFSWRQRGSWSQTPQRAANVSEVERRAREYGLPPIAWPPGWPPNTLTAMRAATWAASAGAGEAFARSAFRRAFVDGEDLGDLDVLAAVAESTGLGPDRMRAATADAEVKDRLRTATEDAYRRGVVGVPCLAVGDQVLYGDDRLEDAAALVAAG